MITYKGKEYETQEELEEAIKLEVEEQAKEKAEKLAEEKAKELAAEQVAKAMKGIKNKAKEDGKIEVDQELIDKIDKLEKAQEEANEKIRQAKGQADNAKLEAFETKMQAYGISGKQQEILKALVGNDVSKLDTIDLEPFKAEETKPINFGTQKKSKEDNDFLEEARKHLKKRPKRS